MAGPLRDLDDHSWDSLTSDDLSPDDLNELSVHFTQTATEGESASSFPPGLLLVPAVVLLVTSVGIIFFDPTAGGTLVFGLVAISCVVAMAMQFFWSIRIRSVTDAVQSLADAPSGEKFHDALNRVIKRSLEHEEADLIRSRRRSTALFLLGVILLLASVFCPIGATIAYVYLDPLPQDMLTRVEQLKKADGEFPKGVSLSVQRDWRILIGGVTFGFLLLGSATALLRHKIRETVHHTRSTARTRDLVGLQGVAQLLDHASGDAKREIADVAIRVLIPDSSEDEANLEDDPGTGKEMKTPMDLAVASGKLPQ